MAQGHVGSGVVGQGGSNPGCRRRAQVSTRLGGGMYSPATAPLALPNAPGVRRRSIPPAGSAAY